MSVPESPNPGSWTEDYQHLTATAFIGRLHDLFYKLAFFDFVPDVNASVADVGCGDGRFLRMLERRGYRNLQGVEPDPELRAHIARQDPQGLGGRVHAGFATDLPFADAALDCVTFFNVLHHLRTLPDYSRAVAEVDRCLAPGGTLVLVEPCGRYIYGAKRALARGLAPVWPVWGRVHAMMMAEKEDVTRFFDHHARIRQGFTELGYRRLRDRRLFHQWLLVMRKPD